MPRCNRLIAQAFANVLIVYCMNAYKLVKTNPECEKAKRAEETIVSYAMAIKTLRERYLEDRLPGESTKEWLKRMGQ